MLRQTRRFAGVGLLVLIGCTDAPSPADGATDTARADASNDLAAPDASAIPDASLDVMADASPPAEASVDAGADGGAQGGRHALREDFNAMSPERGPSAPWTSAAGVTVRAAPFADDHSVELTRPAGVMTASLSTTLPGLRGRVVFEAKVMARETAGFKAIPYVYDRATTVCVLVVQQEWTNRPLRAGRAAWGARRVEWQGPCAA